MFAGAQAGLRSEELRVRLLGRNEFDAVRGARSELPESVALFTGVSFDGAPTTVESLFVPPARISDGAAYPGEPLPRFINPFADLPQILPGESQNDMREPVLDVAERLLPSEDERIMSLPSAGLSSAVEEPNTVESSVLRLSHDDSLPGIFFGVGGTYDETADISSAGGLFEDSSVDDLVLGLLDPLVVQSMSFEERCDLLKTMVQYRQTLIQRVVGQVQDLSSRGELSRTAVERLISEMSYVANLTDFDRIFGNMDHGAERALLRGIFATTTQAVSNLKVRLQTLHKALKGNSLRAGVLELVTGFTPNVRIPFSSGSATVEVPGSLYALPQALNAWLRFHGFVAYVEPDGVIVYQQEMFSEFRPRLAASNPLTGARWDEVTGPDLQDPYLSVVLGLLNWEMSISSGVGGTELRVKPQVK